MANLDESIRALRPFLPVKDLQVSMSFYADLGFSVRHEDANLAIMGQGGQGVLLQNFYVKELAENLMVQMVVADLDTWWERFGAIDLAAKYGVKAPTAPKMQPWGIRVTFLWDPAGVLWHVIQAPPSAPT